MTSVLLFRLEKQFEHKVKTKIYVAWNYKVNSPQTERVAIIAKRVKQRR